MGMWSLGLGAVGAALAGIFLANTDLCLPKTANTSLEYLEETDLRSTTDGRLVFLLSVLNVILLLTVVKPTERRLTLLQQSHHLQFFSTLYSCMFV